MFIRQVIGTIMILAITTSIMLLVGLAFKVGIEKSDRATCIKYQEQSEKYEGFYLVNWQKEMCDHYGIVISSSVKSLYE